MTFCAQTSSKVAAQLENMDLNVLLALAFQTQSVQLMDNAMAMALEKETDNASVTQVIKVQYAMSVHLVITQASLVQS